jgi:diguanylate cyclase (GGDEF)-like protein
MSSPSRHQRAFVLAVTAAGAVVAVALVATARPAAIGDPVVLAIVGLVVLGELTSVSIPRRGSVQGLIFSTTFIFALLLYGGPALAALTAAVASILGDLVRRLEWDRVAFNAAQYVLVFSVGGVVLAALGYEPGMLVAPLAVSGLLPVVAAGAAMLVVNNGLVAIVIALGEQASPVQVLAHDLRFNLASGGVLLALAPIVVIIASHSLLLIPVLLVLGFTLHRGTQALVERELAARRDPLTQLPNRLLFHESIDWAIDEAAKGQRFAVFLLDLDRFREINDTLGHGAGDRVIVQASEQLRAALPEAVTLARVGGDEFGVLLPDASEPHITAVTRAIKAAFSKPFAIDGLPLSIGVSAGLVHYPDHGQDADTLMRRADVALYLAKERHSDLETYHPDRDRHSHRRLALISDLQAAIEKGQLHLHYQPKVDAIDGVVTGVEALVRWRHPEHGNVPPDEFIPLAEATGLIAPLTHQVLTEALKQCARWRQAGFALDMAVNLSAQNLHEPGLYDKVETLLRESEVEPSWLDLEITESTVMTDPEHALTVLDELAGLGVRLTLDDFGTGHSSLTYLRRLPVSQVKVDRSFVTGVALNDEDATIVRATVYLAKSLNMEVVAEGVEDPEAWTMLTRLGCDRIQGYLVAKPMEAHDLTMWLFDRLAPVTGERIGRFAVVPPPVASGDEPRPVARIQEFRSRS